MQNKSFSSSNDFMSAGSDHFGLNDHIQSDSPKVVLPGDFIGLGYISGHGTRVDIKTQKIFATVSGVVQFIDRVISVQPLSQGYWPDVGDLVVGRVVQVD